MDILAILLGILINALVTGFILWLGMKITKVNGTFLAMLLIGAITALVGYIPMVGWLLSIVALFVLITKWTDAQFWPDAVLMVVVAKAVGWVMLFLLGGLLASIA